VWWFGFPGVACGVGGGCIPLSFPGWPSGYFCCFSVACRWLLCSLLSAACCLLFLVVFLAFLGGFLGVHPASPVGFRVFPLPGGL